MSLSVGIVGLPNVGKSTLFNAITKKQVPAENYPFCTIDPSVGVVAVPDERLDRLAEFSKSEKKIPAVVEFVDIAGLVEGASKGAGLGNQFLSHIREVDAIAHMVRVFEDTDIAHVYGALNPLRDIEIINTELILADLDSLRKRLTKIEKDLKKGDKQAKELFSLIEKILPHLEEGKLANQIQLKEEEKELAKKHLQVLTLKPVIYVLNKKHDSISFFDSANQYVDEFREFLDSVSFVELDAWVENELKDIEGEEKEQLLRDFDIAQSGLDALIKKSYEVLGLISFFTTGEKETKAWTIKKGSTAPQAAGKIHTDFEKKFIRAEVINWADLLNAGSKQNAKAKGLIRSEGKDYIVKDGDVIEFLHGA